MCRHLAYVGAPVHLSELLFDPPHSLEHQAWAPREMRGGGTINADGFGVGWYQHPAPAAPISYRRAVPLWHDTTLPQLARAVSASAVLAAVRSATPGMPVVESAAAPFGDGRWLFSHNGTIAGWPNSVAGLAGTLPITDLLTLPAASDSALLWALIRDRLRAGVDLVKAVADTVTLVATAAPGSRLNVLLTDGETIVATTVGHALSVRHTGTGVLVSSEPLDDDPAWRPVPEWQLLHADSTAVTLTQLGEA